MRYPVVLDLAADGIPVAVTCRGFGVSKQGFYAWLANPVTPRDADDALAPLQRNVLTGAAGPLASSRGWRSSAASRTPNTACAGTAAPGRLTPIGFETTDQTAEAA